jgi:DNA-binding MarR family transcriptional regulator
MPEAPEFELREFLPYLLNQAAEQTSLGFQKIYRDRYGMLRTEWRVLAHLGRFGPLTASQIVDLAALHKTKVSRAVRALEGRRFVARREADADRRSAVLSLTPRGQAVLADLTAAARDYDAALAARFPQEDQAALRRCLRSLAGFGAG